MGRELWIAIALEAAYQRTLERYTDAWFMAQSNLGKEYQRHWFYVLQIREYVRRHGGML